LVRGAECYIYIKLPGELTIGTAYTTRNMPDTNKPRNVNVLAILKPVLVFRCREMHIYHPQFFVKKAERNYEREDKFFV
jgi:hypothetical protein